MEHVQILIFVKIGSKKEKLVTEFAKVRHFIEFRTKKTPDSVI